MKVVSPAGDDENGELPALDRRADLVIPERLPLLPIRDLVVFPYMVAPLMVSREISVAAVNEALTAPDRLLLLATQRSSDEDRPQESGVHAIATVGTVLRMRRLSDGRIKVLVQGLERARVLKWHAAEPCILVRAEALADPVDPPIDARAEALIRAVREDLDRYSRAGKLESPELALVLGSVEHPGRLADMLAAQLPIKGTTGQVLLDALDPVDRLERVGALLKKEVEIVEMQASIQSRAREEMSRTQREYFLREQLRQIQSELGGGAGAGEAASLRAQLERARLPAEAQAESERQLRRLEQLHESSAESGVLRTHLEWLAELPWHATTDDRIELQAARRVLDEDHDGLAEVKDRILEFLGVLKLGQKNGATVAGAPILCFVGPPGVGKTSLGRSIARALGRRFVRVSLGGLRDEAEVRGHRRTYVGAMPGRLIQAMRQAGTMNPVILLDEIDKLGAGDMARGDPAAALLEVLDAEQNASFRDHYLGVGYNLSRVMFLATANTADPIPRALGDRMEMLRLSGYSEDEKVDIAARHLVGRQLRACGLQPEQVTFAPATLRAIIADYTREAGLRDLERQIAQVCRKVARQIVEDDERGAPRPGARRIAVADLERFLGPPQHRRLGGADSAVGTCQGLAWTPYGGEVLPVEAQLMPGKGSLILTGQLGDVMKESAMTALSFARAFAAERGIDADFYAGREVHIHVPAGAVPKDGPSAGVTMACALVSLLMRRPLRPRVAMTGEITLRGHVLPVGGLREKLLAARRAGLETVILPDDNRRDVEALPPEILGKGGLTVVWARTMDDVIAAALGSAPAGPGAPKRHKGKGKSKGKQRRKPR